MTAKQAALEALQQLPDDASWEEVAERIQFRLAVEEGLEDHRQGRTVPHDQVRKLLDEWLQG